MKRVLSIFLLAVMIVSANASAFAQRTGSVGRTPVNTLRKTTRIASYKAFTEGSGVFIKWQMDVEVNNFGFYVYRIDSNGKHLVSPNLVGGSALRVGRQPLYGQEYEFFDAEGDAGSVYSIETLNMNGTRASTRQFATQYVSDLKPLAGYSPEEFLQQAANRTGNITADDMLMSQDLITDIQSYKVGADIEAHRAVIAQPGVRIGVRTEGVYRVAKAALQSAGFDTSGDSSLWQLYVEGIEQAIIVGPNADYIEFYGKGIDTVESDTRIYYLISGAASGKRIRSKVARASSGAASNLSYAQTFIRKERSNYVNDVINGDADNYWGRAVSSTPTNINFMLTGVDFTKAEARMTIRIQGYTAGTHSVQVTLNDQSFSPVPGSGRTSFSADYIVPTSVLREGSNTLRIASIGGGDDFNFFDTLSIDFGRKYLADQNRVKFFTDNYRRAKLEGFTTPNIRVFDTTDENSPAVYSNLSVQQSGATYGMFLPAARGRLMYAFDDSALLQPASIEPNDPAMLAVPSHEADLVILSHKNFLTEAENWANYRRGQGTLVKVINVTDIYDEFNFGVLSSNSVEAFLRYAKENWQKKPGYVLFLGDASHDSRNYEGRGYWNLVPTRTVATLFSETGSDDAMVDFDNNGFAEMAVGRICARTPQIVTDVLTKVMTFEQQLAAPLDRGALFAFDVPNGYDFHAMSTRLSDQLPASMPKTMISRGLPEPNQFSPDPDAGTSLNSAISSGKFVVNYSGHGSTGSWANPNFFSNLSVPNLTNANSPSIFTMLTCLNGYFSNSFSQSLAENLVEAPNRGAVAAWSASGLTSPLIQEIMGARFYNELGKGEITRLGDLIVNAKSAVTGPDRELLLWSLIGDPMLKVR